MHVNGTAQYMVHTYSLTTPAVPHCTKAPHHFVHVWYIHTYAILCVSPSLLIYYTFSYHYTEDEDEVVLTNNHAYLGRRQGSASSPSVAASEQ